MARSTVFRLIAVLLMIGIAFGVHLGLRYFRWIYKPNTTADLESAIIRIPHEATFAQLKDSLVQSGILLHLRSFEWVAGKMKFDDEAVKSGQFRIENGMTNREIIHRLRLGDQFPVQLVLNNGHTIGRLSAKISSQMEVDSADFHKYLVEDYLPDSGYEPGTILSMFIPNSYELYWNASAASIVDRLRLERDNFWDGDKRAQAEAIGLTPLEVYTLASIIERETHIDAERKVISGVYHNRLQRGIALQADPTVLFALNDPSIKRVLYRHLEVDSPYNTYKYAGLPPGPIAMPSMSSLMAALYPESHDYLYFCAKPGADGHLFASSLNEHNRNARAYQSWLNSQGIK